MNNDEASKQIEDIVRLERVASAEILQQSLRTRNLLGRNLKCPNSGIVKNSIKNLEKLMLSQSKRMERLVDELASIRERLR